MDTPGKLLAPLSEQMPLTPALLHATCLRVIDLAHKPMLVTDGHLMAIVITLVILLVESHLVIALFLPLTMVPVCVSVLVISILNQILQLSCFCRC